MGIVVEEGTEEEMAEDVAKLEQESNPVEVVDSYIEQPSAIERFTGSGKFGKLWKQGTSAESTVAPQPVGVWGMGGVSMREKWGLY